MEKSLEDKLIQAIIIEDEPLIIQLLSQGANPNKTASHGKTCLGEAANMGNVGIVKILVDATKSITPSNKLPLNVLGRKRQSKSHKRKLKHDGQQDGTVVKCKNVSERSFSVAPVTDCKSDKNQGYFIFMHSDGSSSDDGRITSLKSLSPSSLTPSPQADLEWDEDIVNVAPTTSEDETWSSMYKWYAAILECSGAAIASASTVTNGIDQQDVYMRTALHYAAEQGHTRVLQLLLDAGCKINISAGDGLIPLHVAVVNNNIDIVRMLLASGSNVNYKTHEKMTPLHFAASRGYLDMVINLVNNGAYLEARDTSERTALYLAAGRGHIDVVKYLISAGANVNGEEIHGYTPLCEAVWQRYTELVRVLLSSGARTTHSHKLLHNAIIQRQDEIVTMLASLGGGINIHNDNGDTPLLLAARLSQSGTARMLLENGANVNCCNSITGSNALHIAVEGIENSAEFEDMLLTLLEYNIDMDSTALTGDTALNRALLLQKDEAAVLLIRHGADVNAGDLHSCGLDNISITSRRNSEDLSLMLRKAGHYVSLTQLAATYPAPHTTVYRLYQACRQPLSLLDLSRISVRSMKGPHVLFRYIDSLHLPRSLKRFLIMQDEGI